MKTTSRTATGRWKKLRQQLIRQAGPAPRCHHCGRLLNPAAQRGSVDAIEVDHVVPFNVAPQLEYAQHNLVLSCHPCNRRKGDRIEAAQDPRVIKRSGALKRPQ